MSKRPDFHYLRALLEETKNSDIIHLDRTVHNIIGFFIKIQDRLASEDKNERKEALQDLETLHSELQKHSEEACKKAGMTPEQLKDYMHNKDNFTPAEWEVLRRAEGELLDYEKELLKPKKSPSSSSSSHSGDKKKKRPPPRSDWISG
jgi:hypothetical protein